MHLQLETDHPAYIFGSVANPVIFPFHKAAAKDSTPKWTGRNKLMGIVY
jgi:hypothetical protein